MDKVVIKTIPKKKNYKKAKWFSEEALQIAEKRRDMFQIMSNKPFWLPLLLIWNKSFCSKAAGN